MHTNNLKEAVHLGWEERLLDDFEKDWQPNSRKRGGKDFAAEMDNG